jgi:hypothetical protein
MGNGKGWTKRTLVRKTVQLEESDIDWIEEQAETMDISSNEFIRRIISSFRILQNFTLFEALKPASHLEGVLWDRAEQLHKMAEELNKQE